MDAQPVTVRNFVVEIAGENIGLSTVSGIGFDVDAGRVSPITLRRAASRDSPLWQWARDPEPRTVSITLLDARMEAVCRYLLRGVRPVKFTGPELNATGNDIAIEELEISAEGLEIA